MKIKRAYNSSVIGSPMGRGGFSLPDLGGLKSPLPLETEGGYESSEKPAFPLNDIDEQKGLHGFFSIFNAFEWT